MMMRREKKERRGGKHLPFSPAKDRRVRGKRKRKRKRKKERNIKTQSKATTHDNKEQSSDRKQNT